MTPPGMKAHQLSGVIRNTSQKLKRAPPGKRNGMTSAMRGIRVLISNGQSRVKRIYAGNDAHQFLEDVLQHAKKETPPHKTQFPLPTRAGWVNEIIPRVAARRFPRAVKNIPNKSAIFVFAYFCPFKIF
jgi:hypothetical protein